LNCHCSQLAEHTIIEHHRSQLADPSPLASDQQESVAPLPLVTRPESALTPLGSHFHPVFRRQAIAVLVAEQDWLAL